MATSQLIPTMEMALTGAVMWEGGGVAPNNGLVLLGSGILVSGLDVVGAGAVTAPSVGGGVAPYSGLS